MFIINHVSKSLCIYFVELINIHFRSCNFSKLAYFYKLQDVTQYFIKILFKSLERINDARLQLSHMIVMPLFATIINLSFLNMGC